MFVVSPAPDEDETLNSKWFDLILKGLKLLAYIVTFGIVLCSAVVSKGTLLLMTSLIKPNRTGISVCNQGIPGLDRDKKYEAIFNLNDPERIAWIWSLLMILIVPELMALFRSCRICTFKSYKRPSKGVFSLVFLCETLHTIGVVLLVFVILPSLDVVKGAMITNCLCFIPVLLSLLSRHSGESKRAFKIFLDLLCLLSQFSSFVIWPMTVQDSNISFLIPISTILISVGFWENYVDKNSSFGFVRGLAGAKNVLHRSRYFTYIFISCWKIIVFFLGMVITRYWIDGSVSHLFTQFKTSFSVHKILIVRDRSDLSSLAITDHNTIGIEGEWIEMDSYSSTPIIMMTLQIITSWLCYVVGKFACKIMIQGFSFAFPLSLTVPITISMLIASCGIYFEDSCNLAHIIPRYLFWSCPSEPFVNDGNFFNLHAVTWLLWLLSQTWITIHIWIPKCERLATTEKLFINPMYSSAFIDQSMAMNRRRDDEEVIKSEDINLESEGINTANDASQHYETISEHPDDKRSSGNADQITKIYACATMWHETNEEMIQMLKSCMRMDEDQSARRNAQKYLRIVDPDYYEFEGNLFRFISCFFLLFLDCAKKITFATLLNSMKR